MNLLFEAAIPNIKNPQDSLTLNLSKRNQEGFKHIIIQKWKQIQNPITKVIT